MSTALYQPYAGMPMVEVVPHSAEVRGVSKSSILAGRRRLKLAPQTGTTAQPGQLIQFVVADSAGLLDCNSMVLTYTQFTSGTGAVLDEGHPFKRVQVSLNGSLLEDLNDAHRATNAEIYASATPDAYKTALSFANFWKFNNDLVGSASAYMDVAGHKASRVAVDASGVQVMMPMGLIANSMRTEQYLPLRNMGEVLFTLTLANANEAVWSTNSTGNFELKDIYLE